MTQSDLSNVMATSSPMQMQYNTNQMDVTASTIASQNIMSGGKLQYTPVTPQPQASSIQSINLNQQLLQLLQSAGVMAQQQPNHQPNVTVPQQLMAQQNFQPTQSPQQPDQSAFNPLAEVFKQLLVQAQANQGQNLNQVGENPQLLTNHDPNLQDGQNQEMNSLGSVSLDQNLLQSIMAASGGNEISFDSLEGLSGLSNLDYDPNVAGFETVGGDGGSSTQQYDETTTAVQNLN